MNSHTLSHDFWMTLEDFDSYFSGAEFNVEPKSIDRISQTRRFIDHLLSEGIRVYGLTTGFADLRNRSVSAEQSHQLSENLIRSHDAGIGNFLHENITYGAMIVRAHSLIKGCSGFSKEALQTLLDMINCQIIPEIPETGSLGASGDLAFLARLGRSMMGDPVPVRYRGQVCMAGEALKKENIRPFYPLAKEGLALTNGTSFMASMLAQGYQEVINSLDHVKSLSSIFLNAVQATDAAFYQPIHDVRYHAGQSFIAEQLAAFFEGSDLIDRAGIQDDYSIRCLPQLFGPRFQAIFEQREKIENELNAATDNPLIFRGDEITPDVDPSRRMEFEGLDWIVVSGGNFHGEILTTSADIIRLSMAKIALILERQLTYLLNPFRNGDKLPLYLIPRTENAGLESGHMITQYTANALTHKICHLAYPAGLMNLTSANEAEDLVSYGATACQKLLEQNRLFEELISIYLICVSQAYALTRPRAKALNPFTEEVFEKIQEKLDFPYFEEEGFDTRYAIAQDLIQSKVLLSEAPIDLLYLERAAQQGRSKKMLV